ncbi:hypothetical protein BU25DRAFT_128694 [Macroventuria anomochaeta]|uniref:Uncharacterized protein n=1 Tax=Macroventuria anomochaeta TaxID=301207 RepID=A0ACB6RSA2_9PLEO|nr:uncharacterized protein BU25DRAFT_128694 [Macroventuria anomochaeta]KAF2624921.1 hypothetical protein BU25DRAFT_128694 [Macroventuria anomochaeta]
MAFSQDDFWERMGLQEKDRTTCVETVRGRYDGYHVEKFEYQGYCSFTLLLSPQQGHIVSEVGFQSGAHIRASEVAEQLIVQIRPAQHALDLDTAWAASRTHSLVAPMVRTLDLCLPGDLCAYEMNRLEGTPVSRLHPHERSIGVEIREKQRALITSFTNFIAQSWPDVASKKRRDSVLRPDSPSNEEQTILSLCTGKVGSCIVPKLQKLAEELPDQWLRERAQTTLDKLRVIDDYPVVLNHGDLIPSNILVIKETWEITGLVDWAEAEYLPFGTCLYGLEYLLGFLQPASQELDRPTFVYYDNAPQLQAKFWTTLLDLVPGLGGRQEEVRLMRDIGVLLWHGYAWDEGTIDRVVDEVNDGDELAKLRAFLSNS